MTSTKILKTFLALCLVVACALPLSGCRILDRNHFLGTWKVKDSEPEVTVVFTEGKFRNTVADWSYSLGLFSKTITMTSEESSGEGTYSFNDDYTKLTIVQTDDEGNEVSTVFLKVSDDTTGEPSVG